MLKTGLAPEETVEEHQGLKFQSPRKHHPQIRRIFYLIDKTQTI